LCKTVTFKHPLNREAANSIKNLAPIIEATVLDIVPNAAAIDF
jgi:hypothetical protein